MPASHKTNRLFVFEFKRRRAKVQDIIPAAAFGYMGWEFGTIYFNWGMFKNQPISARTQMSIVITIDTKPNILRRLRKVGNVLPGEVSSLSIV